MKNFVTSLVLLVSVLGFSQSKIEKETIKVEALTIELTVKSQEELELTVKEQELDEFFKLTENDIDITFKLNCSFNEAKAKLKGSMTYIVKGKANNKAQFFTSIKKAKSAALKFYNLKNRT